MRPLDESLAQAAFAPEPPLGLPHAARISLVIVAEQMEEAVQGEDTQLGELRVACAHGLASRDAAGDDDLAEQTVYDDGYGRRRRCGSRRRPRPPAWSAGLREAEDVGRTIDAAVLTIEAPDPGVAHERQAHDAARARGRHAREPARHARRRQTASAPVSHQHAKRARPPSMIVMTLMITGAHASASRRRGRTVRAVAAGDK